MKRLFQLTHPWGCDHWDNPNNNVYHISTHTPVRVWPWNQGNTLGSGHFNSHTREGVTDVNIILKINFQISTHTPVRVWLQYEISPCSWIAYFNSHTREGVTERIFSKADGNIHFNSHTREGVTLRNRATIFLKNFNSHTREGVTWFCRTLSRLRQFQLTHPWGCDFSQRLWWKPCKISTHTPVRVWQSPLCNCFCRSIFQLTHPWGCDRCRLNPRTGGTNFNSHTREGVTETAAQNYVARFISTHTPVRVWQSPLQFKFPNGSFQLTHPWGCDQEISEKYLIYAIFQLTHPWGCDAVKDIPNKVSKAFQLTHPWGCDRWLYTYAP